MQFVRSFAVTLAVAGFTAPHAVALEEYQTLPGTRAMAMAGAFAAYAADSSSIWYNPAGLGFQGSTDFTIEYGDMLIARETLKDNGDNTVDLYDTSKELKYLGFSAYGLGVAYFRPYEFSSYAYSPDTNERARIVTTYRELKLGFGFDIDESLAFGISMDMIFREGKITDTNCTGYPCADDTDLSSTGLGATLGVLYKTRIIEKTMTDLHLSAVYRSSILAELDSGSYYTFDSNEFEDLPTRPTTISLGAALRGPVMFLASDWAFFATLTAQYDITEFEKVILLGTDEAIETEFTKTAFGVELQAITPFGMSLFFRAGMSDTDSDGGTLSANPAFRPYTKGIKSKTLGFGVVFGDNDQFVLDYAVEKREIQASDFLDLVDEEETLSSLSFSMVF